MTKMRLDACGEAYDLASLAEQENVAASRQSSRRDRCCTVPGTAVPQEPTEDRLASGRTEARSSR